MAPPKRKADAEEVDCPPVPSTPQSDNRRAKASVKKTKRTKTPKSDTGTNPLFAPVTPKRSSNSQKTADKHASPPPSKKSKTVQQSLVKNPTTAKEDRLLRAQTERMVIIDHCIIQGEKSSTITFDIVGSIGNIYKVKVGERPRCDCPDFAFRRNRCKHIVYCLLNGLSAPEDQIFKTTFSKEELDTMLSSSALKRIEAEATAQNPPGDRKPIEGDCAICFMAMKKTEKTVWCQHGCGNNLHVSCFKQWSKTCGTTVTCVYCRALWNEAKPNPKAQTIRESGVRIGQYLNVGMFGQVAKEWLNSQAQLECGNDADGGRDVGPSAD